MNKLTRLLRKRGFTGPHWVYAQGGLSGAIYSCDKSEEGAFRIYAEDPTPARQQESESVQQGTRRLFCDQFGREINSDGTPVEQESEGVGLTGYEGELFRKAREAEQRACPSCQSEGVVAELIRADSGRIVIDVNPWGTYWTNLLPPHGCDKVKVWITRIEEQK